MIRHTIVTSARDLKNDLSLEELKSLERAMDHSVKTAERVYQHNKQQLINDNTKIIEFVLELNGRDKWYKEIQEGMEDEIEKGLLLGDIELKEEKEDKEETDEEDEADKKKKKKKKKKDLVGQKIGNRWRKFTNDEADLVRRLFRTYIEAQVKKRDPISTKEIKQMYKTTIDRISPSGPYAELLKFDIDEIAWKVRTIIQTDKRQEDRWAQRQEQLENAWLDGVGKGNGKGKGKGIKWDPNPKLQMLNRLLFRSSNIVS